MRLSLLRCPQIRARRGQTQNSGAPLGPRAQAFRGPPAPWAVTTDSLTAAWDSGPTSRALRPPSSGTRAGTWRGGPCTHLAAVHRSPREGTGPGSFFLSPLQRSSGFLGFGDKSTSDTAGVRAVLEPSLVQGASLDRGVVRGFPPPGPVESLLVVVLARLAVLGASPSKPRARASAPGQETGPPPGLPPSCSALPATVCFPASHWCSECPQPGPGGVDTEQCP